ncbi:hypothetical protein ADK54_18280 [Streptomyces sp. WM6378]|nr:hypothetical protein ADK54_18280 [Streptomyces sp. WM6378]
MPASVTAQNGDGRQVTAPLVQALTRDTALLQSATQPVGYLPFGQTRESSLQIQTAMFGQCIQVRC